MRSCTFQARFYGQTLYCVSILNLRVSFLLSLLPASLSHSLSGKWKKFGIALSVKGKCVFASLSFGENTLWRIQRKAIKAETRRAENNARSQFSPLSPSTFPEFPSRKLLLPSIPNLLAVTMANNETYAR